MAVVRVGSIGRGSVNGVEVDNVGTNYEVGETITFTPVSADTNVKSGCGFYQYGRWWYPVRNWNTGRLKFDRRCNHIRVWINHT